MNTILWLLKYLGVGLLWLIILGIPVLIQLGIFEAIARCFLNPILNAINKCTFVGRIFAFCISTVLGFVFLYYAFVHVTLPIWFLIFHGVGT